MCVKIFCLVVTNDTEPFVNTPKASVISFFSVAGSKDKLCVINIHGRNRGGLEPFVNQLNELAKVGKKRKSEMFC